jgi:hypothetical protein
MSKEKIVQALNMILVFIDDSVSDTAESSEAKHREIKAFIMDNSALDAMDSAPSHDMTKHSSQPTINGRQFITGASESLYRPN